MKHNDFDLDLKKLYIYTIFKDSEDTPRSFMIFIGRPFFSGCQFLIFCGRPFL